MLEEEREREAFRDYVGQTLWYTTAAIAKMSGNEPQFPQYVELLHPELKKKEPTAKEIKKALVEKLIAG